MDLIKWTGSKRIGIFTQSQIDGDAGHGTDRYVSDRTHCITVGMATDGADNRSVLVQGLAHSGNRILRFKLKRIFRRGDLEGRMVHEH